MPRPIKHPRVRWTLFHSAAAICVLTYVWRVQDLYPVLAKVQLPILATLVALALFLVGGHTREFKTRARHPVFKWAAFLLVLMVLSVPIGIYPGFSFSFLRQDHFKTFLLMMMLAIGFTTFAHVERLVAVHVIGSLVYCWFVFTRFQVGEDGRLGGLVYYDSNDLGLLLVATLPLTVYFLRKEVKAPIRLLALLGAALAVLMIIRTGSRGAFLALIAVSIFMLFAFKSFSKTSRIGTVIAITLGLTVLGSEQYWEMMQSILHPQNDYNVTGETGRMTVWKRGIGYMLQRPLLGVGVNNFPVAEGTLSARAALQDYGIGMKWSAAHNSFVQIGAELGFPGLIGFVLLLWTAYRSARNVRGQSRGATGSGAESALGQALAISLIGYIVAGFFLSQAYSAFLYSILGMTAALSASVRVPTASPDGVRWSKRLTMPGRGNRAVRPSAQPRGPLNPEPTLAS